VARPGFLPILAVALALMLAVTTATSQETDSSDSGLTAAASGTALFDQNRYAEALEQLDAALAAGPRDARLLYMAARCQQETSKGRVIVLRTITEAMPLLEAAITSGSADLADHAFLADAKMITGNEPGARQAAREGMTAFSAGKLGDMATMDTLSLQRLGEMAIIAQDWETAARALDQAVKQSDTKGEEGALAAARALSSLGTGQLAAGDSGAATESLQRSIELNPDDPGTQVAYARALFHDGQYSKAAEQWRQVRMSNSGMANDATYASMTMRTLAQAGRLQQADRPLEDLSAATPAELEQKMLEIGGELNALAASLPPEMVKRGFSGGEADEATRTQMSSFRDLKLRLAWTAATYVDRGMGLREFAFSRGLQGYLRDWRLPKDQAKREPEPLPLEWLSEKQRQEYLDAQAAREKKKAGRKKKEADGS
jgi:tetratricopeptide (TPR) repeat protein